MKVCSVDGCERKHAARGLCTTHYNQQHQPNRHAKVTVTCTYCGSPVEKSAGGSKSRKPFCDYACRDQYRSDVEPYRTDRGLRCEIPRDHPVRVLIAASSRQKSPLRAAYEAGDGAEILRALREFCRVSTSGCWIWQRGSKGGYPQVRISGRDILVHRLSLEAHMGKPLGKQPAHHKCATTMCVNPMHLQPVTERDNIAEMLARNYMLNRIAELEAALAVHDPEHPLLREVGLSRAS